VTAPAPKTATCPVCKGIYRQGKSMSHHLRDAHQITGMTAHKIANPNDKQAKRTITGQRAPSVKAFLRRLEDDFQVIE
jgi:uncharacterized C2H2 Zn-finger protein